MREKGQGGLGWWGVEVMLIGINNRARHYNEIKTGCWDENMNGWQLKNKWPMNRRTFWSTAWKWYKYVGFLPVQGAVIMSLHGDLGQVIFSQDVHATTEYLCDRGLLPKEKNTTSAAPQWELAAWSTWRTRPYSATERSAARPPRVGAVVHSSRSPSSFWINGFTSFIYGACQHQWPRLVPKWV